MNTSGKNRNKKLAALLALCCTGSAAAGASLLGGSAASAAETKQLTMGDLPYYTWYSEYKGHSINNMKVKLMYTDSSALFFDATKSDYNLKDFSAKVSDNALSLNGFTVENWQYKFPAAGGSVVTYVEAEAAGTIAWDYTAANFGGYIDWNSLFAVYKYEAATKSVTQLAKLFHIADGAEATIKAEVNKGLSVEMAKGDVIYYELGAGNARNYQNMQSATITFTAKGETDEATAEQIAEYTKKLEDKVSALSPDDYTAENWALIQKYLKDFKGAEYTKLSVLKAAYEKAVSDIDAVKTNTVDNAKAAKKADMAEYWKTLKEENYTAEGWTTVNAAHEKFLTDVETAETAEDVNSVYDTAMAAMKAVVPVKEEGKDLDYCEKMNANGYTWITGVVADTKLMTGTVADGLLDFDKQGADKYYMYNESLNAGFDSPKYFAQNWKWYIGRNAAIVQLFKANKDSSLTFSNVLPEGKTNGWTENCVLNVYIVRGEETKKIATVSNPVTQEDFSGVWYMKAGDVLYFEFASNIILEGQVRNFEAPCYTTYLLDSSAFDEEKYTSQNHDLPQAVKDKIAEKKAALEAWFATLTQTDYSATNWALLQDEIASFAERCETEVKTAEDAERLYNEVFAAAQAVETIAQAEATLKKTLQEYADELQAKYDELIANNKYTKAARAALDEALADGKEKILSAKSKTLSNSAKLQAIAALNKVETKSGCGGIIGFGSAAAVLGAAAIAFAATKKKKEN